MFKILKEVVNRLPSIMSSGDWDSQFIDYDNPTLHRMFRKYKDYTINLHKFIPTNAPIVYHPHPWPAAFIISAGSYEMYFGYGRWKVTEPIGPVVLRKGSYYQMTNIKEWHSVRPLEKTYTLVVEGSNYKRSTFEFETNLDPLGRFRRLNYYEKNKLWDHFSSDSTRSLLKDAMAKCPEDPPKMTNYFDD
jgi:hypothetical protein